MSGQVGKGAQSRLGNPRFTDQLQDLEVEESLRMGRFQYNGGVQASPRPSTGNDLIIWRDQPGVSGHKSDLHSHFVTLRHALQRVSYDLFRLPGIKSLAHAAAHSSESVGSSQDLHPGGLEIISYLFR